jgi:hypothetical protein
VLLDPWTARRLRKETCRAAASVPAGFSEQIIGGWHVQTREDRCNDAGLVGWHFSSVGKALATVYQHQGLPLGSAVSFSSSSRIVISRDLLAPCSLACITVRRFCVARRSHLSTLRPASERRRPHPDTLRLTWFRLKCAVALLERKTRASRSRPRMTRVQVRTRPGGRSRRTAEVYSRGLREAILAAKLAA